MLLGWATNEAISKGDNVNTNDVAFRTVFPFLSSLNQPRAKLPTPAFTV